MNWGYKLLFTYLVFIGLMGYLVYRSVTTNFLLVEKEYYKSELQYQKVIDASNRANALSSKVKVQQQENEISIQLPDEMKKEGITGTVWFYCAYDDKRDKYLDLKTDAKGVQKFDAAEFLPGNYIVKIEWNNNNQNYYSEEKLTIL